jgi:hypothetical protein
MIVLTLIIALLIVFVVGLFAFELNRVEVARSQLRSGTEAAALAAVTTLASQQSTNTMQAHTDAIAAAMYSFQQNEVLGTQLNGSDPDEPGIPKAYQAASNPDNPPIDKEASLYLEFLDPNSNPPNQVVPMGDDRGKAIRCYGNFHYQPAFAAFTGVGDTYLHCMSTGGVPDLDVVLCFDVSGSIDDQTKVTLVKRYLKYASNGNGANAQFNGEGNSNTFGSRVDAVPSGSSVRYFVVNDPNGSNQSNGNTGKAIGTIYGLMDPPATGTSFNAVAPQGYEQASYGQYWNNSNLGPNLHGTPHTGSQPPNSQSPNNDEGTANLFTDAVVNLDGNIVYSGFTYNGSNPTVPGNPPGPPGTFAFPSIPVLVEAQRGNLENPGVFASSGAQTAFQQLNIAVFPQSGYQAAYNAQAFAMLQPIGDAKRAASLFYTLMNNNTKGHFGLVTFSTTIGTSPSSTWTHDTIATNYGGDPQQAFPNPMVPLNSAAGQTGYTSCVNSCPQLRALESTNIEGSLASAYTELTTHQRPNAKRAIVLFTDGQPTVGQDPPTTTANNCATKNIPIYCIGLAQNAAIITGEVDRLNDGGPGSTYQYTDPITGSPGSYTTSSSHGIAYITRNAGGKFYLVTNSGNLGIIFGNIARSLCALVK